MSQVKLDYSLDGGSNWNSIVTTYTSNGSYSWTLPDISTTSNSCLVKIRDYYQGSYGSLSDESDDYFTIANDAVSDCPTLPTTTATGQVTSPAAGSVVSKGSAFTINWSFKNGIYTPGQCHIKLFNGNTEVSSLQNWANNDGVYTWNVSSSLSNSDCYNIRIIHTSNSSIYVIGSYFTIQ